MNNCTYNIRKAHPYYQNLVNRIKSMLSMNHSIEVFEASIDNACATLYKKAFWESEKPIITYNPNFISQLYKVSPWAVVAVFAHEVAHHYNGDLHGRFLAKQAGNLINYKSHKQELNADYIAGWVLSFEGASLHQTTSLYYAIAMPDTYTHPATHKRIQAATDGWLAAKRAMAA